MNNEYRKELLRVYGKPLSETQLPDGFEWEYMKDVYAVVTRSWIGVRVGNIQFRCGVEGEEIKGLLPLIYPQHKKLLINLYDTLHKVFDREKNNRK